jgi:acyl-CoA thioesterase FadM
MTVAGPFSRPYRVRFDEAGADGWLRPSGYLRYAQDVAWQHSDAEGYDREWYAARQSHWLVRSVMLRLLVPVAYGTRLAVSTEVTGWRRVLARRRTRFVDEDGVDHAELDTDWALLGPGGRPASVPAAIVERFAPGASFAPVRVALPSPPPDATIGWTSVRDADVDPMGHLNNAAYVDLIDTAVGAVTEGEPGATSVQPGRTYRLEYLRPAAARSDLEVVAWPFDADHVACVIAADGVELCRAVVGSGADLDDDAMAGRGAQRVSMRDEA